MSRPTSVFDLRSSYDHFFFNDTATTEIYTLSLHDALPIWLRGSTRTGSAREGRARSAPSDRARPFGTRRPPRSEEHTSELQSPCNLVCRLLLEKKKKKRQRIITRSTNYVLIAIYLAT